MKNNYVIGIHYRGSLHHNDELDNTDYFDYGKKVSIVFDHIDSILNEKCKIYLATDCKSILDKFINKYSTKLLYNKNNIYMNSDIETENEVHFGLFLTPQKMQEPDFISDFHKNKPGLDGGIQLMIDVLLLSKCDVFIPSFSNMSDFVSIINPDILLTSA